MTNLKSTVEDRQISLAWDDSGADLYRITRSDGRTMTGPSTSFVDSSFLREKVYSYSVAAVGWDGTVSAPVSITVTPLAELKPPPAQPFPDVSLESLSPKGAQNGAGKAGLNAPR